jgi:hypothetical protein
METTPSRKFWADAGTMKNAHGPGFDAGNRPPLLGFGRNEKNAHSKTHAENRRIIEFPLVVMQKFRAED